MIRKQMKKQLLLLLTLFITSHLLQAQSYRYTKTVFPGSVIQENVVFSDVPQLNPPYNDETNTTNIDLTLDLYQPEGDTATNRPAIVFIHGGAFVSGNKNHDDMMAFCDTFARKGYVTVTINYRLGMYPTNPASCTRAVYRGLQDGRTAVRFLRANAALFGIDAEKIYMAGSSAGGFIALHDIYMNDPSEKPAEAGSFTYTNPLFPFNQILAPDLGNYDIGNNLSFNGMPDIIVNLWGALEHTDLITAEDITPVLLIHGTDDQVVPFNIGSPFSFPFFPPTYGSNPINNRLEILGQDDKETYFVIGEGHEFYGISNGMWNPAPNAYWDTVVKKTCQFFYDHHHPAAGFLFEVNQWEVNFTDTSINAVSWLWDFGDNQFSGEQNPFHSYAGLGEYYVTLYVEDDNLSWDTASHIVNLYPLSAGYYSTKAISCYPNPARYFLTLENLPERSDVTIFSVSGIVRLQITLHRGKNQVDIRNLPSGFYFLQVKTNTTLHTLSFLKTE